MYTGINSNAHILVNTLFSGTGDTSALACLSSTFFLWQVISEKLHINSAMHHCVDETTKAHWIRCSYASWCCDYYYFHYNVSLNLSLKTVVFETQMASRCVLIWTNNKVQIAHNCVPLFPVINSRTSSKNTACSRPPYMYDFSFHLQHSSAQWNID